MQKPYTSAARATFFACFCLASTSIADEMRVFHSADGKPLKAALEGVSGDSVSLKREDGKVFNLPKNKLSAADQQYITEFTNRAANASAELNKVAGHQICDGSSLAERKAEDLATALGLRPESQSKYGRSWRLYAAYAKDYTLFGAMPYSVALYSDQGGFVSAISIVYANKGDFGSTAGFGQDHFAGDNTASAKTLAEAMDRDYQTVSKALGGILGEGKPQRHGEGKSRRTVTRWDWNGHAFLLSNEEGEYVGLSVMSSEMADNGGRSVRISNADVKERLMSSIVKSDNGDIYLSEIPMVNQGPKGYCVPATFERTMRTMGIEADMYLLAMVGESKAGGGTSVGKLLENVRSQVYRKGRRTKDDTLRQLRIRDVKRYIDQGIPVMWTMCSVETYNNIANENTTTRNGVSDWQEYAAQIASKSAEFTKADKPEEKHHICMIIGYNESTQEIAVSDSWGPRFERRWVPVPVANWVSNGGIFMILP